MQLSLDFIRWDSLNFFKVIPFQFTYNLFSELSSVFCVYFSSLSKYFSSAFPIFTFPNENNVYDNLEKEISCKKSRAKPTHSYHIIDHIDEHLCKKSGEK